MVRPIKFRAWHKYGGGMMVVDSLYFINDLVGVVDKSHETRVMGYSFADVELMQYTGLKDKNGTEIYEGDVVKHNGNMKSTMKFVEEEAGFKLINKTLGMMHVSKEYFGKYMKVIGNIYENPDLLKGADTNDDQS